MSRRVFVSRPIPAEGLRILRAARLEGRVRGARTPPSARELARALAQADGAVVLPGDPVRGDVLRGAQRLRIVAVMAVGYDNVDVDAARERGIVVTHTPGVLTEATADLAWALILATARRVVEADRFVRAGRFAGWDPLLLRGIDLRGKTIGIVGYGRIGRAVARRARAFGMRVLFTSRRSGVPLRRLLAESDVVSIHCPLTAETRGLIGRAEFRRMKRGAILVNTARGPIVNEAALVEALRSGRLGGAGLDVYEREPRIPRALLRMQNVVLLPHIGSATWETRARMAETAARDVVRVLRGRPAAHPVPGSPRSAGAVDFAPK
jgi:glyoxylate reductase